MKFIVLLIRFQTDKSCWNIYSIPVRGTGQTSLHKVEDESCFIKFWFVLLHTPGSTLHFIQPRYIKTKLRTCLTLLYLSPVNFPLLLIQSTGAFCDIQIRMIVFNRWWFCKPSFGSIYPYTRRSNGSGGKCFPVLFDFHRYHSLILSSITNHVMYTCQYFPVRFYLYRATSYLMTLKILTIQK